MLDCSINFICGYRSISSLILVSSLCFSPLHSFQNTERGNAISSHQEQEWVSRYFNSAGLILNGINDCVDAAREQGDENEKIQQMDEQRRREAQQEL